ncbi:hypothetical protein [Burkholderia stagnalis]|uniref:Uncharacterized protein n=1 Tax=Burkholderia stagnalis TaxID=1503054 RepID=A0A6L3N3R6_9BURK|nr:hypothetical protein [Burkholderia stagnalis]KAB0639987.1 hypothetical protein F7R25_06645 [Burkholderia stagnalis]KVN02554.1 hypothetical protein WT07_12860 [Burkholderia stagnalis]KVO50398.1 hypothetical protein WT17_01475 [Burkholderia stagnalis]KVO65454.1 hypothetical protein WT19_28930 [Burkholderia stagnalis]KVX55247.1 hypothetical protein WT33_25935 [Burkholderia stagnalis]
MTGAMPCPSSNIHATVVELIIERIEIACALVIGNKIEKITKTTQAHIDGMPDWIRFILFA